MANGCATTYGYGRQYDWFMTVHHTTYERNESSYTQFVDDCLGYDFLVMQDGCVATGTNRWGSSGCHSEGCNCHLGVAVHGCFQTYGICTQRSTPTEMSLAQVCGLGTLYEDFGYLANNADAIDKMKPHNWCDRVSTNPCGADDITTTGCPGATYIAGGSSSDFYWNDTGIDMCNAAKGKAIQQSMCGTCWCG